MKRRVINIYSYREFQKLRRNSIIVNETRLGAAYGFYL
jgi:hypothetical protein